MANSLTNLKIAVVDPQPARADVIEEGLREAGYRDIHHISEMTGLLERLSELQATKAPLACRGSITHDKPILIGVGRAFAVEAQSGTAARPEMAGVLTSLAATV